MVRLDHHHRHSVASQLFDYRAAETAVAAYDDVFLEIVNSTTHCGLPEKVSKASLNDQLPDYREEVDRTSDSCDYQSNRKKTTDRAERLYLLEAHSRYGDNGHVKGVENRHMLYQDVAGGADHSHQRDQRDCKRESAGRGHLGGAARSM